MLHASVSLSDIPRHAVTAAAFFVFLAQVYASLVRLFSDDVITISRSETVDGFTLPDLNFCILRRSKFESEEATIRSEYDAALPVEEVFKNVLVSGSNLKSSKW